MFQFKINYMYKLIYELRGFSVTHLFSYTSTTLLQPGIQIYIRSIETNFRFYKTNLYVSGYNWTIDRISQLNILTRLTGFQ